MDLQKFNPWNWLKHEETEKPKAPRIPVTREQSDTKSPALASASQVLNLHREMDRLFEAALNSLGLAPQGLSSSLNDLNANFYRPQIDISGNAKSYEIMLDMPGLSESDINIELKGDVLIIRGEKEEKNESSDTQYYRVERSYGAFQRTLSLPDDAIAEDIDASLKDGVLKLVVPRREHSETDVKKIVISSEN